MKSGKNTLLVFWIVAGLDGDVQQLNAGIAVQMCKIFIDRMNDRGKWSQIPPGGATAILPAVDIDEHFSQGKILLQSDTESSCQWEEYSKWKH